MRAQDVQHTGNRYKYASAQALLTHSIMYPLRFDRQIIIPIFVSCLCAASDRVVAAIYTCTDTAGQQTFTDRGCPGNSIYQPPSNPAVNFAPLTSDEITQLRDLSRQATQTRVRQQKSKRQRAKHLANRQDQRTQNCNEAVRALQTIAKVRRKGYKLSAATKLEESQAALKELKRENC